MIDTIIITEEEYYNQIEDSLNEGVLGAAATALGYANLTGLALFGGAILAKSAASKEGKIRKFLGKIFKRKDKLKSFEDFTGKPGSKREIAKAETWEDRMPEVFKAIKAQDWDEAAKLFQSGKYSDNEEAIKAIVIAVTDVTGEPPLFVYPSGNSTYFVLKKIIGIKYAKAATNAVLAVLKQDKNYYDGLKDQTLKVNTSEE